MISPLNLSAVVLAKNEAKNIEKCLQSLKFCNEIVVIDDNSDDETSQIAVKNGAKVFKHKMESDFSLQRNYGIEKAQGKWIFFVDADEIVTKDLANEIIQVTSDLTLNYKGFLIKRSTFAFGRKIRYGEFGNIKLLRLARKGAGKWKRPVHEYWNIEGRVKNLKGEIIHYSFDSLAALINKINKYSTMHAMAKKEEGAKSNIAKVVIYPAIKLLNDLLFKRSILDGNVGFLLSMVMSFHSFLSWSKLWLYQKRQFI